MAIGTPVNTLAGAYVGTTTQTYSIPAVAAGNILLLISHARRGSATLAPDDATLVDSSAVPLVWTKVWDPFPVQIGPNPSTKANWWWAVADGAAKTVSLTWLNASSVESVYGSVASFTIGAGKKPDFTNKASAGASASPVTVNLPVAPTAGMNLLSFYGAGGSASATPSGYTLLTSVASRPYRIAYDMTPVTSATMTTSGFPASLMLVANIVEISAGATEALEGVLPANVAVLGDLGKSTALAGALPIDIAVLGDLDRTAVLEGVLPIDVAVLSDLGKTTTLKSVLPIDIAVLGNLTETFVPKDSLYGMGLYGMGFYSVIPTLFEGSIPILLGTNAALARSTPLRTNTPITFTMNARISSGVLMTGGFTVGIGITPPRLTYTAYFDQSTILVNFGVQGRLTESEPLSGAMSFNIIIPNAPMRIAHVLRAAFEVNTYFPLARPVLTRGYRADTAVLFDISGVFTRSGSRLYTAAFDVSIDIPAIPLYVHRPFGGVFEVLLVVYGNEWIGPAWDSPEDVLPDWDPEYPPDAPWIPKFPLDAPWAASTEPVEPWIPRDDKSSNWIPITNTRYFDG